MEDIRNESLNSDKFYVSGRHIPKIRSRPPLHGTPEGKLSQVSAHQEREIINKDVMDDNCDNIDTDNSGKSDNTDNSESEENALESDISYNDDTGDKDEQIQDSSSSTNYIFWLAIFFGIFLSFLYLVPDMAKPVETFNDISAIKTKFPEQSEDLWLYFESGVADVVMLNRPSTFIFLYDETSEKYLKNLINALSAYAVCNIRECDKAPINLTDSKLNSPEILADYGTLIEEYRTELADKGVMVIHNLEKIRGISAQAFHSFCDEFTPLVQRSLFMFTMKVSKLPRKNQMKFVEEDLKKRWNEVKPDILVALITRITSMVVEVV